MKKNIIALAAMFMVAGSAMACQTCGTVVTGSQNASVKGSANNSISTFATAGGAGAGFGTSTSIANSTSASAGAAGGVQGSAAGGAYLPIVGNVSGTATGAVIGAGQATHVDGYASNTSTGSGSGFGVTSGAAAAETAADAKGGIVTAGFGRNGYTLGGATYKVEGTSSSGASGYTVAGTNSHGDFAATNAAGFVGGGAVALANCDSNVNFVVGGVGDMKASLSTVKSSTGNPATSSTSAASAGSDTTFIGSYEGKSYKNGVLVNAH